MNIAVAYVSRGGNTKKVADAIAEELGVKAIEVTDFNFNDYPEGIDLLFLGSAVYAAHLDKRTKGFIDSMPHTQIKKVVLFGTSAGGMKPFNMMREQILGRDIPVDTEYFYVRGQFMFMNRGKPNAEDLESAKVFARKFR